MHTTLADIICRHRGHRPMCTNVKPHGTQVTCNCLRCRKIVFYVAPHQDRAVLRG